MPFSGIFSDIIRYSNVIFPIPDDVIVIIALPQFCIISPPVHLFYPTDICVGGHGFEPVHYIANGCTVFFIVYSIFIIRCEMNDWFIRCGAFGCFNLGDNVIVGIIDFVGIVDFVDIPSAVAVPWFGESVVFCLPYLLDREQVS